MEAAIFVVVHTGPSGPGMLANLLERGGQWPASVAEADSAIEHRRIYVAPPGQHMVLEREGVRLVRGPLENRNRPSIDTLFRSAAKAFGSRVIGVILSGYLDDGTAGAIAIQRSGGVVIAQDPGEALAPGMPQSVISSMQVDHVARAAEIPGLLARLTSAAAPAARTPPRSMKPSRSINKVAQIDPTGRPSAYTCPECHGTLWEVEEEGLLRFACRVGHSFSANSMVEGQEDSAERALWAAMRALEERADLSARMAAHANERGQGLSAQRYLEASGSAAHDAGVLRNLLTNGKRSQAKERHDPQLKRPA